ncbi:hypothetical protein KCTC52924_01056 [Arenibacter antarcticus]|uniref:Lipoprotein n=1 Tax=Arenibacter antarcticus TaxID=2040469 RepID=A0ABW5VBN5_9FLAO|nr:hypothetical protein [Arenibacter sp. H213]MCM4167449.1 hypothetical protein [Arenibacter sp. H213]
MKTKITFLLLLSLSLINCKQAVKESPKSAETQITTMETNQDLHLNNDWVSEIALNNGIKWEANLETTTGVAAMSKLISESKTTSTEDYKRLGNALNEVKNTLVKECTMTGASHDNLHVFLHPLIEKIELLQKTATTDEGVTIKNNISDHLEGYYTYFK